MISINLTHTAEYALRAMSWLALLPPGQAVTARELSEATFVPVHYLLKIMRQMVSAGLVASAKGHGGGFSLAKPPKRISFMNILSEVGYNSQPNQCVFGWGRCSSSNPCPMHDSWSIINSDFSTWAESTTLASIRLGADAALPKPPAAASKARKSALEKGVSRGRRAASSEENQKRG